MDSNIVTRRLVPAARRVQVTADLFGVQFPLKLEPAVFAFARDLCPVYRGGYWQFYSLSNGGFYMAPELESPLAVSCENGFARTLSADALGITACLYAYSHLSFSDGGSMTETWARHYHWVRAYALGHSEGAGILAAID